MISQSRRWRHPSGEFAKLLARTLLQLDMLASSVFFETSIPNTPPITVLSFHFISSARAPPVRRLLDSFESLGFDGAHPDSRRGLHCGRTRTARSTTAIT